ncbi:hypothetical protein EV122DRAFT_285492 [Schizophyllum commune]
MVLPPESMPLTQVRSRHQELTSAPWLHTWMLNTPRSPSSDPRARPFSLDDAILFAALASHTEDQDVLGVTARIRAGVKLPDFDPFEPVNIDIHTGITYREEVNGKLKHSTNGVTVIAVELCARNKIDELSSTVSRSMSKSSPLLSFFDPPSTTSSHMPPRAR